MTLPNESRAGDQSRLKLLVAYDGAGFRGWQSQAGGDTIQDRLERAFGIVTGEKIRVHGAGRTDSGVHALGQCAHADVVSGRLAPDTWKNALNASLPPQIRVVGCRFISGTFHARFSARGKVYRYRIATTPVLSPLDVNRAWHISRPLDDVALRKCAALFVGTHDFAGFAASRGTPPDSTTRTIRSVRVHRTAAMTVLEFNGDGFLYKMVRLMTGAVVRVAQGKDTLGEIEKRLETGAADGARLVAPAGGLTLMRVRY